MIPEELLRLAKVLASSGAAPVFVSYNGAVSTAYYALFHALAQLCGRELVGASKPWEAYRHVYRSLEHSHAEQVLKSARSDPGASPEPKAIADFFLELKELRHGADYDPGFRIARDEFDTMIDKTGKAIALLKNLAALERKMLAAQLIGRTRRKA